MSKTMLRAIITGVFGGAAVAFAQLGSIWIATACAFVFVTGICLGPESGDDGGE